MTQYGSTWPTSLQASLTMTPGERGSYVLSRLLLIFHSSVPTTSHSPSFCTNAFSVRTDITLLAPASGTSAGDKTHSVYMLNIARVWVGCTPTNNLHCVLSWKPTSQNLHVASQISCFLFSVMGFGGRNPDSVCVYVCGGTHRVVPSEQQSHRQCTQPSAGKSHERSRLNPQALAFRHTWIRREGENVWISKRVCLAIIAARLTRSRWLALNRHQLHAINSSEAINVITFFY